VIAAAEVGAIEARALGTDAFVSASS